MKATFFLLFLTASAAALDLPKGNVTGFDAPRIVGGTVVTEHELPYQLSLRTVGGSHFCGASILNKNYAITAAHCADVIGSGSGSGSGFSLVAGEHSLSSYDGNIEQRLDVSQVIIHSSYNKETLANDIALLRVASPFNLNAAERSAKAIKIPPSNWVASGNAVVSGWGYTSEDGNQVSDLLRKVTVPIISDAECGKQYGASAILDTMICAGDIANGGKDSCQGDSGGPLTVTQNGTPYLVGIVSFGSGCARKGYAGVYTEVSKYVSWINNNAV